MDPITPPVLVAALACAWACWTDVREGKIYNALTLPMIVVGVVMNVALGSWQAGLLGVAAGWALYYPLWLLGVQRGGDAKLWMGLGALLGPWFLLEGSAWYAPLYLIAGLGMLVFKGRLSNLAAAAKWTARKASGQEAGEAPPPTMLRTAPVIATAAAIAFATPWMETLFGWSS